MNKIIILLVIILLFYRCTEQKDGSICECAKKVNVEKVTKNEEFVYLKSELIIKEGRCFPEVTDKYLFPVCGYEQWYTTPVEQKLKMCQLPDSMLKSISTIGLIRSFIDVPWDIGMEITLSSNSNYRQNYYNIYQYFNCVQEILTRDDAVQSLIFFYSSTKLDCYETIDDNWLSPERDLFHRLKALEYLFTIPEIVNKLSHRDKIEIVKSMLDKNKQWQSRKVNNSSII